MRLPIIKVTIDGRPPTINGERTKHWRSHRATTEKYRELARVQVVEQMSIHGIEPMALVKVDAFPYYKGGRIPDTGACMPSVKAIIDGAVDAGLMADDTPDIVRYIGMHAPVVMRDLVDHLVTVTFEQIEKGSAWDM